MFSITKVDGEIRTGTPTTGATNAGGSGLKLATFDGNALTRKRYKIGAYFLLKSNRKSYVLYQMAMYPMTLGDP